jgi:hypothetical protein
MTPEERQKLDEQMAAAQDQMRKATLRFNNPQFQQELHDRLRVVDSPDFKAQMDKLKVELKPLDSDTIRLRIADSVQLALDNPAIKHQIEQAQQMAAQARVQSMRATAQFNQRIAAARQKMQQAIRAAKGDPDQIQKAVDQFTQEVQSASAAFSHT